MAVIKPAISFVPAYSGNYAKGRSIPIQRIILHWIVGEISASDAVFTKKQASPRSAHYAVGSVGEIHQYVADKDTAWHAGNANAGSIGIEHAGGQLINGIRKTPTQSCHDSSARLVAWLCQTYKIPCNSTYIRGHSSYMQTQCPGTLNMSYIIKKANELISNYQPPPMANRNDVYNLYKTSIDKHKALAAQVRPDVAKAYGENFYWEHFISYSNEYFEQIIRMRQLETENKLLTGSRDTIANARPGFDALYKYLHSIGIRRDIYEHILKGGDSALWTLVHGQKDIKTMIEGIVKERDALKAERDSLKKQLNELNTAGNIVSAIDRLNETIKNKP